MGNASLRFTPRSLPTSGGISSGGCRCKRVENQGRFTQCWRVRNFSLLFVAVVAGALASGCGKPTAPPPAAVAPWEPTAAQPRLATTKLYAGPAEITAEMALSPKEIMTGMMFRTNIVESEGMIFHLRFPQQASFWMKNCPEPMSCAYIDPQGVILEIREMEPNNTNSIVANSDNVLFVLETARGWFERHGVRTGMVIQTESGPLLETLCSRLPR